MNGQISSRAFRRRGRRALGRMTERQRLIFGAVRLENATYAQLGVRLGMSEKEVQGEFACALHILFLALTEREAWWQPLWPPL